MSKWTKLRKAAREAGAFHADGGEDRRNEFASRGTDLRDAYDSGYQNRSQEIRAEAEAYDHPLRQISREAEALAADADHEDVHKLAGLVERLADYLADKEDGR